jgi:hypothetical protein
MTTSKAKIVTRHAFRTDFADDSVGITFIVDNAYEAKQIMAKIATFEILEVNITDYKKKRSVEQNRLLWGIIDKISMVVNGSRNEYDTNKIYSEILEKANIKYEFILALPATEQSLRANFRAVIDTGQTREINGVDLKLYKVYEGSSNFSTKEMQELIEYAIMYANEAGVTELEIRSIQND